MAENDVEKEVKEIEEQDEDIETPDEDLDDDTDWKAEATKSRGIAQRLKTKLAKANEAKKASASAPVEAKKEEKKGFDYAEKAYLKTSGITADEFDFVKEVMDSTGKSLDDVLETKYFQAELKERRDAKATKEAIPTGSKRSASSAKDSVDYWIAKGELPPADQRELRQKVVNARIKAEGKTDVFASRSVIGG